MNIANPTEYAFCDNLFEMWAGAYGDTKCFVWAKSFDDAFEVFTEWLDDNAPEMLSKSAEILSEMTPEERAKCEESGEIPEHTTIGHTTLKHGDCVASWEWGGSDVQDEETYDAVAEESDRLSE